MGREGRCRGWGRILDFIYALVYALGWGETGGVVGMPVK